MGGNLWKTHLPTEPTTTLHRPNGSRRWKGRYLTKRQKLEEARPPETWLKVGQSSMVGTKWCCSGTSLGYFLQGSNWHSVANFCSSSDTIWWKGTIWNLGASVSAVMAVFGPQTAKGGGSKVYQSGLGHKHEVNSSK